MLLWVHPRPHLGCRVRLLTVHVWSPPRRCIRLHGVTRWGLTGRLVGLLLGRRLVRLLLGRRLIGLLLGVLLRRRLVGLLLIGLLLVALWRIPRRLGLGGWGRGLRGTDVLEDGLVDHTVLDGGPFVASWRSTEVPRRQAVVDHGNEWEP